jgi:hypothetical protein
MNGHHLVLGELEDCLTGDILTDTHDERYRQDLARLLLDTKGYRRADIQPRTPLTVAIEKKRATLTIDFVIRLASKSAMVIQYSPGSIVTRHRPVLAISRLLTPYQIPIAVATNGEDADVLDARTGCCVSSGLAAIPARHRLYAIVKEASFQPIEPQRAAMEARILYAYEVDGRCPCDDTVCGF